MRMLEVVQFGVVVAAVAIPVIFGRRLRRGRMAVVLVAAMLAQVLFEGYRWQLLPMEFATVLLAAGDALWEERRFRGLIRFRRGVLGSIAAVLVAVLPVVFPIPRLPDPAGPFAVGTLAVTITDPEREETYGLPEPESDPDAAPTPEGEEVEEQPGEPRRLVVQIWYPAPVVADLEPVPWNPDFAAMRSAIADLLGVPDFMIGHLEGLPAHAQPDPAVLDGEFPVVVGSHDWLGFRTDSLDQIEALASHGFVVVVPDHTYVAAAVQFPDDEDVTLADVRLLSEEEAEEDPQAYLDGAQELVEVMADDLALVLDQLAEPAPAVAALVPHMDLDTVGLYGHGAGGAAAARFCLVDDRCDGLVVMNPWVEAISDRTVARELQIPSLMIRSEDTWGDPNDRRLRGMAERSPQVAYWIGIAGTVHNDFTLAPLLSPFSDRFGWSGSIDPGRTSQIVDTYLVAFFERFLLGVGGSDLDQPPPAEVDLELIR